MKTQEITAALNLATTLMPIVEAGAVGLLDDIQMLLRGAHASEDATPEQLHQVQELLAKSDAAQDAAYQKYQQMINPGA